MKRIWIAWRRDQSGLATVITAIMLAVIFGVIGLSFDLGHYYVVNQELKNAADAGALAGVRAIYPYDLSTITLPFTPDCATPLVRARETAEANKTDKYNVVVSNIQVGHYNLKTRQFQSICSSDPSINTNAVRVTTRRENVPLYFMQLLGLRPYTFETTSTALMDWAGSINPAHHGLGLAIGEKYVDSSNPLDIFLNDDTSDTGGWYSAPPNPPSDSLIKNFLDGNLTEPACIASLDHQVSLDNGIFTNVVHDLDSKYKGGAFVVPVVETVKFNQNAKVVGLRAVEVLEAGQVNGKKYVRVSIIKKVKEMPTTAVSPGGGNPNIAPILGGARLVQ